ncbi:hypothetical protein KIPB_013629, partial [Kipferlia bialata]
ERDELRKSVRRPKRSGPVIKRERAVLERLGTRLADTLSSDDTDEMFKRSDAKALPEEIIHEVRCHYDGVRAGPRSMLRLNPK